jgi:hypothetical protein
MIWADDPGEAVRAALAACPHKIAAVYEKLSGDPSSIVRAATARRMGLGGAAMGELAKRILRRVRHPHRGPVGALPSFAAVHRRPPPSAMAAPRCGGETTRNPAHFARHAACARDTPVADLGSTYIPRRPDATVLHRLVREHYETFVAHTQATYAAPLPQLRDGCLRALPRLWRFFARFHRVPLRRMPARCFRSLLVQAAQPLSQLRLPQDV